MPPLSRNTTPDRAPLERAWQEFKQAHNTSGMSELIPALGLVTLDDWLDFAKRSASKRKKSVHKISLTHMEPPPRHLGHEEKLDWAEKQMNNAVRDHLGKSEMSDAEVLEWRLANKVEFTY